MKKERRATTSWLEEGGEAGDSMDGKKYLVLRDEIDEEELEWHHSSFPLNQIDFGLERGGYEISFLIHTL